MKKTAVIVTSLLLGLGSVYTALAAPLNKSNLSSERGLGWQNMLNVKAQLLNLTTDQLKAKLEAGLNFAEIAAEQNISLTDWQAKLQTFHQTRLQQMVQNGLITQAQADAKLKQIVERQQNHPNNTPWQNGLKTGLRKGHGLGLGLNR